MPEADALSERLTGPKSANRALSWQRVRGGTARSFAYRTSNLAAALESIEPLPIVAVFLLCLLVLARSIPLEQDADEILSTIMSLQKLTVFFWVQDRFGNLLPLLTIDRRAGGTAVLLFARVPAGRRCLAGHAVERLPAADRRQRGRDA